MVISVFFLSMLSFASALDIVLDYPREVYLNESFAVILMLSPSEAYDVKLYVENESGSIISETKQDGWKSSFYYSKSAYPNQTSFLLRITKPFAHVQLCVRLRKPEKTTATAPSCYPLILTAYTFPSQHNTSQSDSMPSSDVPSPISLIPQEENTPPSFTQNKSTFPLNSPSTSPTPQETIPSLQRVEQSKETTNKRIVLETPSIYQRTVFITKEERLRLGIVYTFTFVIIAFLILLSRKRL